MSRKAVVFVEAENYRRSPDHAGRMAQPAVAGRSSTLDTFGVGQMTAKAETEALLDDQVIADLQPGLHTAPDTNGDLNLIAHRCEDCGTRFFPRRTRCVCCYGDKIVPSQLGRIGKVDAFTIVRQAPPGYHGHVPYVLAMVQVDNDVVTLCHLVGRDLDQWKRGNAVASCEFILPVGPSMERKRTYAFRAIEERDLR